MKLNWSALAYTRQTRSVETALMTGRNAAERRLCQARGTMCKESRSARDNIYRHAGFVRSLAAAAARVRLCYRV